MKNTILLFFIFFINSLFSSEFTKEDKVNLLIDSISSNTTISFMGYNNYKDSVFNFENHPAPITILMLECLNNMIDSCLIETELSALKYSKDYDSLIFRKVDLKLEKIDCFKSESNNIFRYDFINSDLIYFNIYPNLIFNDKQTDLEGFVLFEDGNMNIFYLSAIYSTEGEGNYIYKSCPVP